MRIFTWELVRVLVPASILFVPDHPIDETVTFSGQIGLIRELLELEFPYCAENMVVKGRDGSWDYSGECYCLRI